MKRTVTFYCYNKHMGLNMKGIKNILCKNSENFTTNI